VVLRSHSRNRYDYFVAFSSEFTPPPLLSPNFNNTFQESGLQLALVIRIREVPGSNSPVDYTVLQVSCDPLSISRKILELLLEKARLFSQSCQLNNLHYPLIPVSQNALIRVSAKSISQSVADSDACRVKSVSTLRQRGPANVLCLTDTHTGAKPALPGGTLYRLYCLTEYRFETGKRHWGSITHVQ
jgi:hypothetical protein